MGIEKKSRIPREQLLRWLDSGAMQLRQGHPGQESVHLIKLPKTEDIDYIYGLPGGIRLRHVLYFCGVYFHSSKTLRLAEPILQRMADGLTPEECADPGQLAQMLTDQVNVAVEAMIGDDRTRLDIEEVTSPELQLELDRYLKFGARQDVAHSFLSRFKPETTPKNVPGGSAFAAPPAAILDAPALFVAANIGQFRGAGGKLGFLIRSGVAGKAAGQGNFRKGVLCEPNLVIGERFFPLQLNPIVICNRGGVGPQHGGGIAAVRQAEDLFQNPGIGAVPVNSSALQPGFKTTASREVQGHTGTVQRDNFSVPYLCYRVVSDEKIRGAARLAIA